MAREVWGTFSVKDHTQRRAFVADVMLFDRLRIPVPTEEDWGEWEREGWQPERQQALLKVLKDRAKPIYWDDVQRAKWRERWNQAKEAGEATRVTAFQMTRDQLIETLPRGVTGIQSVTSYPDFDSLREDLDIEPVQGAIQPYPASVITAVLGRTFFVPADSGIERIEFTEELELLEKAVELSSNRQNYRRRASYWRWQREFCDGTVTDQETVAAAVEEMNDLLQEEHDAIRQQRIDTIARYAFIFCTVSVGVLSGPLAPATLGSAFITLGQFAWNEARARQKRREIGDRSQDEANVAALFHDLRKHFGME